MILAEIKEISKPLTKMKNKKILLFAGLGLAAGVVVLAVRGAGAGSASAPVTADVVGGDQAVGALGSQMQAFAQQMGESQGELSQQIGESQTELAQQITAFQADVNTGQASIVSQLVELEQQTIPAPAAPVAPVQQPPTARTYTVRPGDNLTAITRNLGRGNNWQPLYNANAGLIGGNPNLIYPGQVLTVPW